MSGYFVTGTDTNVGKTVLSALLVAALDAFYWKPIQTGAVEGTDRDSVLRWAEVSENRLPLEAYRFDPPVSPHLAARLARTEIEMKRILLPSAPDAAKWIVEGAGGVLVPINERELMCDVMLRIGLPVVITARTALGTINHTLLTLSALRSAQARICGVVTIGDENVENRRAIEHYGAVRVVGHVPMLSKINRRALLQVYETHFDHASFS
ncbi:MAG TPA: dethiobiotin synthase [Candidatus Acidoferrales bacterium]|jgi:dethiobiotin synthase|nr:dethiobiotin synthase [Candidatus Acidoferrales bacterium]